jgi:inner membrane protein
MRLPLKLLLVIAMMAAIMVPLGLIRGTIVERQDYRAQAVDSVARSYAGPQALSGPVLVVPYVETVTVDEKNDKGEVVRTVKRDGARGAWTFFPNRLEIRGRLVPSTRRLGLHEVRVYELEATVDASFDARIPPDENPELPRRIGRPWLSFGIADVRGIAGDPVLRVDGAAVDLEEGLGSRDGGGVHSRLAAPGAGDELRVDASLDLGLRGTELLALVPLARNNVFRLESAWPHPRFGGNFLPGQLEVGDRGFTAEWDISSLATSAEAQFLAGRTMPTFDPAALAGHADDRAAVLAGGGIDVAGLSLVDPVNIYSKADRATKYGVLFIVLTFVGFFLCELLEQSPIHPIQYALVGLALAIFFLLLLSLSEHLAFGPAYVIAATACIGLIGIYLGAVLRSWTRAAGFSTALYAALYGLLASEDNALVLGSGLLFTILAALMLSTRRVDWYQLARTPPIPSRHGPNE